MATRTGTDVVELGPMGRDLVLRLLGSAHAGEPSQALMGLLVDAYAALSGGDLDAARTALASVMVPAAALEQEIVKLQRSYLSAQSEAAALAAATPAGIDADLAFSPGTLAAWREALEANIVAQEGLMERITALHQHLPAAR
jgi:hypothetical protein